MHAVAKPRVLVRFPTSMRYIVGNIQTPAGNIPQISTHLDWKDYLGAFKVRWGIRRNHYRVEPGLYAVGAPNERSDVFVTANYKLTFDIVRENLDGLESVVTYIGYRKVLMSGVQQAKEHLAQRNL